MIGLLQAAPRLLFPHDERHKPGLRVLARLALQLSLQVTVRGQRDTVISSPQVASHTKIFLILIGPRSAAQCTFDQANSPLHILSLPWVPCFLQVGEAGGP